MRFVSFATLVVVLIFGVGTSSVVPAAPDFGNQTETVAAVGALAQACTNSGRDTETTRPCIDGCATSKRLIQSEFSKSSPSMLGIRGAFEACQSAHDDAMKESVDTDLSAWVIAGVTLGDDFEKLFETFDKSKAMVEAEGYLAEHKLESSRRLWFYKEGAQEAAPDVISQYSFQIRDGQVFVQGEADGEKKITELLFRQTSDGSGAECLAMLKERYGEPRKESGGTYIWGCETSQGPCLEGEPTDWSLEVRIRHADAMDAWMKKYRTMLSEAKGESSESKF